MSDLPTWIGIVLQAGPLIIKGIQLIYTRYKWRGISKDAREIALAIHSFSWSNLQQQLPTINKIGEIDRPEITQIQNIWQSTDTPILLHGEAGSGKSGIAIRLGKRLSEGGMPVLFIRATEFSPDQDPITILQTRMAIKYPLMGVLSKLSKEKPIAIILDQLDSVSETDLCKNLVGFLKSIAGIPNIKILAITRSYELKHDPDISSLGFQQEEIGRFSGEQSINFLSQLGIDNPSQVLIDLSNNLLNLSLIAEVIKGTTLASNTLINEVNLWEEFYSSIKLREGEEVAEDALRIACETALNGERIFSASFLNIRSRKKLLSRGIIFEASGRRFRFRHEKLQDFLCAYSLLPDQLTFTQLMEKANKNSIKGILPWLHLLYHKECPELEPQFIDDVLGAKKELPFYSRITILENLKRQDKPSENIAKVLGKFLEDLAYLSFFFNDLENPAWIMPLYKTGFFYHPPDPIEVQSGSIQLPDWPAINYLVQFASQYEEILVAITQKALTRNWRIQSRLIEGLLKISPEAASTCTFIVDSWLDSPFSDMLPNDLVPLTDRFIDSDLVPSAIQITDFILKPVLRRTKSTFSRYEPPYSFRSDPYWVNAYCSKILPRLEKIDPRMLLTLFQDHLEKALSLTQEIGIEDFEEKVGYYWRMDIAFSSHSRSDGNITDILIEGVRDSLNALCEVSPEIGKDKVNEFLHSEHLIFQRIAIHTLRKFGGQFSELLQEAISHWDYTIKSEYISEYRGLLRDQYANTSNETKAEIVEKILAGPPDIERRTLDIAQLKKHEPTDDDRIEANERWMQFYFELIKGSLPEQQMHLLEEFNAKYGALDVEEKPKITFSEWTTIPSPITVEELAIKDLAEIKQYFLEYKPENEVLNSRDSLARTFQSLVSKNPTKYIDFADFLIDPAIWFVYTYNYLFGIREAVRSKGVKLTDEILSLCEFVIAQEKDPYENPPNLHEAGLFNAQLEVAYLLNDAVQFDDPYLTREQLDRIRKILIALVHHTNPTKEDDERNKMDPFTHSLNCVRGEAMHGILNYSLYLVRQKQTENKDRKWFIEAEISEILDEKIDIEKEPSPAIRAVIGSYLTQIYFMLEDWTTKNLDVIFPSSQEFDQYWSAAWNGYLIGSNINKALFEYLVPQYQRGLKRLSQPKEKSFTDPSGRLSQHVMVAYLNNLTDFGHENQILDLFYENASDGLRTQAIFWLSKVLENEKQKGESTIWPRCFELWKNRLDYAEQQDPAQNGQEISAYMRWLAYCPMTLDQLYPMLKRSIKYFQDRFDVMQLTGFGSKFCDQSPLEAVSLLNECITTAKETWWNPEEDVERSILNAAMKSNNAEAKTIAIDLINFHGEQGDYHWRDLLR